MFHNSKRTLIASLLMLVSCVYAEPTYHIYLDSDRTRHIESAQSIEMGVKTAFDEINNRLGAFEFKIITTDHRGNTKKSKANMDAMLEDPKFLAMYGGLHSPPLIAHRKFINENKILTLVPWAAGAPITRYPSENNFVFRLSVDDSKAGEYLVRYAKKTRNFKNMTLLLEKTTWGDSNQKAMLNALSHFKEKPHDIVRFKWGTKNNRARILLRHIIDDGADCILFVGNAIEGSIFCEEMGNLDKKIPIISHWGITGGNFYQKVPHETRELIDLRFLQTKFSFTNPTLTSFQNKAFERAKTLFPTVISDVKDLRAPVGFIHAYDLSKIFIQAMKEAELTGNTATDRMRIKEALENLKTPVQGLIKKYTHPFTTYSSDNPDAHEALGIESFAMGYFGMKNEIILEEK